MTVVVVRSRTVPHTVAPPCQPAGAAAAGSPRHGPPESTHPRWEETKHGLLRASHRGCLGPSPRLNTAHRRPSGSETRPTRGAALWGDSSHITAAQPAGQSHTAQIKAQQNLIHSYLNYTYRQISVTSTSHFVSSCAAIFIM